MAGLIITTHLWGAKYGLEYVARLARGVRRNLRMPYKFVVIVDDIVGRGIDILSETSAHSVIEITAKDRHLLNIPGCLVRLRLFDPKWQERNGIRPGDRIVNIDLDAVVTDDLVPLFHRPENFMILQGANAKNPCPYNGSLFMLRAGYRPDVWTDFSVEAAWSVPYHEFPDDQSWLAAKIKTAQGWPTGSADGVYAFHKPGWPKGSEALPKGARLVVFPGARDPYQFTHLDWVKEHWLQ